MGEALLADLRKRGRKRRRQGEIRRVNLCDTSTHINMDGFVIVFAA